MLPLNGILDGGGQGGQGGLEVVKLHGRPPHLYQPDAIEVCATAAVVSVAAVIIVAAVVVAIGTNAATSR